MARWIIRKLTVFVLFSLLALHVSSPVPSLADAVPSSSPLTLASTTTQQVNLTAVGLPQISVGYDYTCAVSASNLIGCWGYNASGQTTVPADLTSVSQVSAGYNHACAITSGNTLRCWGQNDHGQTAVPSDLGAVIQISAGGAHTCALTSANVLRCWGDGTYGQATVPGDLGTVTQVSAGGAHTCALTSANVLRCWGDNLYGQTAMPSDLGSVNQVSAGEYHTCAVTTTDSLRCWGWNNYGQTTVPSDLGTVSQVSVGGTHTCAITGADLMHCWGYDAYGQATVPSNLGAVRQISAGPFHTCAVTSTNILRCWGKNDYGQTEVPADPFRPPPASASITGQIVDQIGMGVPGVQIMHASSVLATTDSNGNYMTDALSAGTYVIAPAKGDYTFSPSTVTVTIPQDAALQNFTATVRNRVSGHVSHTFQNNSIINIADVTVQVGSYTVNTDRFGNFLVANLPNGLYDLHFSKDGYTFSSHPASIILHYNDSTINVSANYTASSVDSGFRPDQDGANFENFALKPVSWELFKLTFPDMVTENSDGTHKPAAEAVFKSDNYQKIGTRNCRGISHASLIWYAHLRGLEGNEESVLSFNSRANISFHDLLEGNPGDVSPGQSDVKDYIHIYQGRQINNESRRALYGLETMSLVVDDLKNILADFTQNPVAVTIWNADKQGHSMVPYRIETTGTTAKIYVYDNERPNDETPYIDLDLVNNTWTYTFVPRFNKPWSGGPNRFGLDPVKSNFPETDKLTDNNTAIIMVDTDINVRFTDSQGRQLSVVAGIATNEIPGASLLVLAQSSTTQSTAYPLIVYYLPMTTTYELDLTANSTTAYTLTTYLNGTATILEGVEISANQNDHLTLGAELRELSLNASRDHKQYCYLRADDNLQDAGRSFTLCTEAAPNSETRFSATVDSNQLSYSSTSAVSAYNLTIMQNGESAGTTTFQGQIYSGATLTAQIGSRPNPSAPGGATWNTVVAGGNLPTVFLPLIRR